MRFDTIRYDWDENNPLNGDAAAIVIADADLVTRRPAEGDVDACLAPQHRAGLLRHLGDDLGR